MVNRITVAITILMLISLLPGGVVRADSANDYWPAWRGPMASGVSPTAKPPLTWSETQNIKWKAAVPGEGTSSPIVWAGKIFFLTAIETDRQGTPPPTQGPAADPNAPAPFHGGKAPKNVYKFDVVCLDRATGRILWEKTAREEVPHEGHSPEHGFASYSPVTDGAHIWAGFGSRGVHCYDVNGEHQWSRDLGQMTTKLMFGEGSSPALAGDALIVVMDHEGQSLIHALDKNTGRTLWKRARDEDTAWATPVVAEVGGRMQVIVSATKRIRSYDVQTGDLIWQCGGQTENVIPSPIAASGLVFCTSGLRGSELQAIELGHTGDLTGTSAVRWQVSKATPYVPSPILYDGKLYVCSMNRAAVSCYDAETGKLNFVEEHLDAVRDIFASPVGAAGRVYFVGRKGTTEVIRNADKLEVLATNKLDDEFDASPAIFGNEIFLKGKKCLYCIGER
ncbi:MAG: PQQ-binding-like beta-propeller repeat protein [Phycisphaerae bacterium]|nr:PQQ-binding-like beta-propeller repeat protein [Phycisphaerae bacterium]